MKQTHVCFKFHLYNNITVIYYVNKATYPVYIRELKCMLLLMYPNKL